jgi:peptidoglycan/LPS O-acetylase OafA/YrhL
MRASSGAHFIALDHVRALAAFMVFSWHFIHGGSYPVPGHAPIIFPLSLIDQGHTGVALFMTLSGYLFAKLLDGKSIDYTAFLWNRMLRLVPLLAVAVLLVGIREVSNGESFLSYAYRIAQGVIFPTLPAGGWSITIEFHYYLILPLFLWMIRKSKWLPFSIILAAIAFRSFAYHERGELQSLAYWTIVGRLDQFALGMLVFQFRSFFAHRHVVAAITIVAFSGFYWFLDLLGGPFQTPERAWILLPSAEGIAYAIGIAWYDNSFSHSTTGLSRFVGRIGEYSYSIYLLHVFVVFKIARFMHEYVFDVSNFNLGCVFSLAFFLMMVPVGYLSFRFIEAPFLRMRKPYIRATTDGGATQSSAVELGRAAQIQDSGL